jgi:hypothetical protein
LQFTSINSLALRALSRACGVSDNKCAASAFKAFSSSLSMLLRAFFAKPKTKIHQLLFYFRAFEIDADEPQREDDERCNQ